MGAKRFSLAELFLWVAMFGVFLAWLMPSFRELAGARDFFSPKALAISADASTAAAAEFSGRVFVWDLHGRSKRKTIQALSLIERIALSGDGRWLAILQQPAGAAASYSIDVWDVRLGKKIDSFPADRQSSFAFSPRESRLAAIADERAEARLYVDETVAAQKQFVSEVEPPAALAFPSDGRRLVVGGRDGIESFDADGCVRQTAVKIPLGRFEVLSLPPDGRRLLSTDVSIDGDRRKHVSLKLYDCASGELKATLEQETSGFNASAAYLPDGRLLLAANDQLHILDSETLAVRGEPLDSQEQIQYVAAPLSGTLFLAGGPRSIAVWNAETLSPVRTLWNSSLSVSRIKEKMWRGLLLPPLACVFTYLLRRVRSRNHRCKVCGERFLPRFAEDWRLGCGSCRAEGRISEQETARCEQEQRNARLAAFVVSAFMGCMIAGLCTFCWLKGIPLPLFSPLSPAFVMMATMIVIPWFTLLFQPPSAKTAASCKPHAEPSSSRRLGR